ncbi:MAG: T9SS C-terminal target domain-containing protein [Ignavibacteriae bacterium]|nr:MAG: T9SS C-terminal target domain-containing protein [Ignavibacteriota bacterium]
MKKIVTILFFLLCIGFTQAQTNNILFEGCTGTWCGWCPCGHEILAGLMVTYPNTIALEYHGSGSDPWINFNGNQIISLLGYTAYPRATIGRREGNLNRAYWASAFTNQANLVPAINLSFTKTYNPATRQLIINATATSLRNIDTATNINFVLYEDNLVYNQVSNSGCPPGGPNYIHKYVVRNMINGALGEVFSTGTWTQGTLKTKSCTTTVDAGWNAANCSVVVFAYFNTPGGILNSQCAVLQAQKDLVITGTSNSGEIVDGFSLSQNYPNPFNPSTNIKFTVPKDGHVTLKVYDIVGNEVSTICDYYLKAGAYNAGFEGSELASGVYFYKLTIGEYTDTKKMTLIK